MAFVVTRTVETISGRRHYRIKISETAIDGTSEWSVDNLPEVATMVDYKATLLSGTASTIQPALGAAAAWVANTQDDIAVQQAAAAHVNDQTRVRMIIPTGNSLYGRTTPDAGADNNVDTEFVIIEGHQS